ncbi:MAG: TonB-dependent receptor [Bacteroidales bacterium]|nr:TonB-dependent receptor [Bacteroidales bacterium]
MFCPIKKVLKILLLIIMLWAEIKGQTILVKGKLLDEEGKNLEGVLITNHLGEKIAQSSDDGLFTFPINPNSTICFSKKGYTDTCITIVNEQNSSLIVIMPYKVLHVQEVIIAKEKNRLRAIENVRLGITEMKTDSIRNLPSLTGEIDPLKVLQLTPGIGKFDLASGLMVRGSTMDQNLVILDEGMIYNPTHLAGFISMFNPYIVDKVSLTKTGLPVDYGGRASSLLIAETDKNWSEYTKVDGNVGLLLTNLAIRVPIYEKLQFTIAFRKSYIDQILKPLSKEIFPNSRSFFHSSKYNFYDGNILLNFRPSNKDIITLCTFRGNDDFTIHRAAFDLNYSMEWTNQMLSIQWLHYFSSRHISKTSGYVTRSDLKLFIGQSSFNYRLKSINEDFSVKHEHRFFFDKVKFKTGTQMLKQFVVPNKSEARLNELDANFGTPNDFQLYTLSAYFESEVSLNRKWSAMVGIRENIYFHIGPYYQFIRDRDTREIRDTIYYSSGQIVKKYIEPDMQISLRYLLDTITSVKFHISRNVQFIQQVNVTTVALPTDFWLPATSQIPPIIANQFSVGYYRNLFPGINFSVECFYKWFKPVIEFNRGLLQSISKATMEENILLGKGRSYGTELFIDGNIKKWSGWISYTLSRSERKISEINEGKAYPSKYDRTHDFTFAIQYKVNPLWRFSLTFTYASGQPTTLPVGRYIVGGNIVNQYTRYNSFRMPPYHRLDISISRNIKSYKGISHELSFNIYNVYSRLNPYFMYYKVSGNLQRYQLSIKPQYVSLFPMMPSISYRFSY